ncbi:MAG: hypothetical protein AAFW66_00075 [Pseudomonadota bacterium]
MPDFTFDGPNKLIIEPSGSGDTSFDVARDLYSAWKRWVQGGTGAPFLEAFTVEGGTPIGATGLFTGSTLLLTNGWKVKPAEHDHQVTLVGNLFSDDGVVAVPADTANATVFVSSSVAAQGVSTSGSTFGLNDIANAVWQHIIEGAYSAEEINRLQLSALAGKASGASTTEMRFRDTQDSKDRIVATVDEFGNRSNVTLDPS